ncbi:hypothetical protein GEMRC1_002830 [Eukaryota sp. GEM-RC1]
MVLTLVSLELNIIDDITSDPVPCPRVKLVNQNLIVDGDEEGHVFVHDLPLGDYELFLMHSDYLERTLSIELTSDKTRSVSMTRHGFAAVDNTISAYDASLGPNVIIPSSINGDVITTIGTSAFQEKGLTSLNSITFSFCLSHNGNNDHN